MRPAYFVLLLLGISLLSTKASQADQAILIGGGYNANSSQGQIELNVKWVQSVLKKADIPVTTFFTDGDDPGFDVHYLNPPSQDKELNALDKLAEQLDPVARLFNNRVANQRRYRSHTIEDVQDGTESDTLAKALEDILTSKPDEPNLIVFNGHGNQSKTSMDKVTMELWNDTWMTAADLHSILNRSEASNRFIFTQCYSGGFHRLAYKNPEHGLELSDTTRCGFTAESAYRLAEGCSASIDTDDYRDYTTYFFAALDGYDRNGNLLPFDTDTNRDGAVSLREAHFYTLENAHSTDLPRSTSEDYLATWQPWYLKWITEKPTLQNNEYAKIFRVLAGRHDIPLSENPVKAIREKMQSYLEIDEDLKAQQSDIQSTLAEVHLELIYAAQAKWPALADPYTAMFQTMLASGEIVQVANWLREQPDYQKLVELQTQDDNIVQSLLDNERNLTQMHKMLHFRNIAKLKRQIYEYGTPEQISDYEKLVACEDKPLNSSEQPGSDKLIVNTRLTD